MDKGQRRTFFLLLFLSGVLFVLLIFPNRTGARDVNMLSIFEVDEFGQFPHVLNMLTPGDTLYQSLRNFVVYLHYFYGYPFYFFSALVLLPVRLLLGAGWQPHTQLIVTTLRLGVNVLPMLAAALLLVWMQTRFRSRRRALGLFVLLVSVPAVLYNDLWWHPNSLAFLFVELTLFFLQRDNLRFGRNFFLAAAACGLAIGTKHLGEFFVLAILAYLIWGALARNVGASTRAAPTALRTLSRGAVFVAVMLAAVVVSNPLLLLPQERTEIIATQKLQFQQTSQGFYLVNPKQPLQVGLSSSFRANFGEPLFLLMALGGLAAGIRRPQERLLNGMILAWTATTAVAFSLNATVRPHYFIPVMLPLYSALVWLIPEGGLRGFWRSDLSRRERMGTAVPWALAALALVQLGLFVRTDIGIYTGRLRREQDSASIAFYRVVEKNVLPQLGGRSPVIYRDWKVYVPPNAGRVELNWDLASYDYIQSLDPDLILLEQANVDLFSRPDAIEQAVNTDRMTAAHAFYSDAGQDHLPGYRVVYRDGFGIALERVENGE